MTRQSELPKHYLVGLNITHDCVWKIQVEIVYSVEGTPSVSMSIICCVRVHHLCDVDILVLTVTNRPLLTIPSPPPPLSLSLLSDWASSPGPKIVGDLLDLASCVGW